MQQLRFFSSSEADTTPLITPQSDNSSVQDEVLLLSTTPNHAFPYVALSIVLFLFTKSLLTRYAPHGATCQGSTTVWKWVNTANSLVHSAVTGIGAVVCVYLHPRVSENVISTYSDFSHRLVSFSVGYFLFDIFDMLTNHRKRSSYELIAHHFFVLICFTLSIITRYYLAFTIISLIVELNSIFLHARQLLLITLTPKSSRIYKSISSLNLLTFLTFRISTLSWMTRWITQNRHLVNPIPYLVGCISIFALLIMSLILFYRLWRADSVCYNNITSSPITATFRNYWRKHYTNNKATTTNGKTTHQFEFTNNNNDSNKQQKAQ